MEKVKLDLKEKHEVIEILGTEALFVGYRVARSRTENGLCVYRLRHDDAGEFCEISYPVMVNLAASMQHLFCLRKPSILVQSLQTI